jgi:hypothetical protein
MTHHHYTAYARRRKATSTSTLRIRGVSGNIRHMRRWSRQIIIGVSVTLALAGVAVSAPEDPKMNSTGYSVVESQIGGTGDYESNSTSYSFLPGTDDGGSTLGDTFAGNSASSNYQTGAGFNTTAQPRLALTIGSGSVNLGTLSSSVASTATATFSVLNYTSYGYVVSLIGSSLSNSGHTLMALTTDTASSTGTEQFGVNLVANTSPVSVGANPAQIPDNTFSFGVAGDGVTGTYGTNRPYTVPNNYRFGSGETVASGPKSSGQTDYTMSFLANIGILTPGGNYRGNLDVVVTGTY